MLREGALQGAAHVLARRARLDHKVHEHLVRQPPEACRGLIIASHGRVRRRRRLRRQSRRLFV
jgi:hypothetical protein